MGLSEIKLSHSFLDNSAYLAACAQLLSISSVLCAQLKAAHTLETDTLYAQRTRKISSQLEMTKNRIGDTCTSGIATAKTERQKEEKNGLSELKSNWD